MSLQRIKRGEGSAAESVEMGSSRGAAPPSPKTQRTAPIVRAPTVSKGGPRSLSSPLAFSLLVL